MKFDVLKEPWIPVVSKDGTKYEMGIYDTLKNAHTLSSVSCDRPIETYAVQRFLIAFLMDAFAPERVKDIKNLYDNGYYNMDIIDDYIEKCRTEGVTFDLFDKERPFYQSAYSAEYDEGKEKSAAVLFHQLPAGNNHLHIDHTPLSERTFSAAECLRALLTMQVFSVAMAQGYPSSVNDTPCYYLLVQGKNLFETLTLNIISKAESNGCDWDSIPVAWRDNETVIPKKQYADISVLAGMTWQPRRITLIANEEGSVSKAFFQQGRDFHMNGKWLDPHISFAINKNGEPYTLKPTIGRLPWRDVGVFLFSKDNCDSIPSLVVKHYSRIHSNSGQSELNLYGLATNQAKYEGWVFDSLSIPCELIENVEKNQRLRLDVRFAEDIGNVLKKTITAISNAHEHTKDGKYKKSFVSETAQSEYLNRVHGFLFTTYMTELVSADTSNADWDKTVADSLTSAAVSYANEILKTTAGLVCNDANSFAILNSETKKFRNEIKKMKSERM